MNNQNGNMSSLEFKSWAVLIACLMFMLDNYLADRKESVKQIPEMKPLTKQEKQILCNAWEDCKLLAEVVVYEARSEPVEGKRLVAKTVLNRVEHPSWPDTIKEVIYEPKQFSYLEDMHKQSTPTEQDWIEASSVSFNILHGYVEVDSEVTFYHEQSIKPFWAEHKELVTHVNRHVFYTGGK